MVNGPVSRTSHVMAKMFPLETLFPLPPTFLPLHFGNPTVKTNMLHCLSFINLVSRCSMTVCYPDRRRQPQWPKHASHVFKLAASRCYSQVSMETVEHNVFLNCLLSINLVSDLIRGPAVKTKACSPDEQSVALQWPVAIITDSGNNLQYVEKTAVSHVVHLLYFTHTDKTRTARCHTTVTCRYKATSRARFVCVSQLVSDKLGVCLWLNSWYKVEYKSLDTKLFIVTANNRISNFHIDNNKNLFDFMILTSDLTLSSLP